MAQCLICEKTGDWVAAFRWADRGNVLRFRELRSLIECREELRASPSSVFAVETHAANVEGVYRLLLEARTAFPRARGVVLAAPELTSLEDLLREAGAQHVVFARRNLEPVVQWLRHQLDTAARLDNSHLINDPRQLVWSRLPWGN